MEDEERAQRDAHCQEKLESLLCQQGSHQSTKYC